MDRSVGSPAPAAGIEQEIAELYQNESAAILRYGCALAKEQAIAHDAVQEAFFRFFLCRSGGQEIRSPKGWLFRVARNYILDQKKAGYRREVGIESLANVPGAPDYAEPAIHVSDLLRELPQIGLSARELECVRLRTEDLRYEEIAEVLGLQAGTVGALLNRAHAKIRKAVEERSYKRGDFRAAPAPEGGYAS